MARVDNPKISFHTQRLRSILAALEFSRGERSAHLREQAREAIDEVRRARQHDVQHADGESASAHG